MNHVILVGHLGRDATLYALNNGKQCVTFQIATSKRWRDKDGDQQSRTDWHNVVCWGYLADRASNYKKGEKVTVSGELTYRKYVDKNSVERTHTEIVAYEIADNITVGRSHDFPTEEPPKYDRNE